MSEANRTNQEQRQRTGWQIMLCWRLLLPVLLVLLAQVGGMAQAASTALPVITDVRVGNHSGFTRFAADVSAAVTFRISTLPDPYRVVIDLPEVGWQLPPKPLANQVGYIANFRYGLFRQGNSRLVLDLTGPARVTKAYLLKPEGGRPHRLVLDIAASTRSAFLAERTPPPAPVAVMPNSDAGDIAMVPPQPKPRQGKRVVMIDPGHGGVDPGAIGVSGVYEKNITLAVSRAIKERLEKTGRYEVVLSRDRDTFIRLRDRIRLARKAGADLFISVHADTIRKKSVRGASVYTLSETASDKEAAQLAERENKADLIAGVDLTNENAEVTNILIDLAQRETMNQAAHFAGALVENLEGEVRVLNNPHRFAGFAVLKAPDIPSVLVELGFLSNRQDERLLGDTRHRAKLAAAISSAVDAYFKRIDHAESH